MTGKLQSMCSGWKGCKTGSLTCKTSICHINHPGMITPCQTSVPSQIVPHNWLFWNPFTPYISSYLSVRYPKNHTTEWLNLPTYSGHRLSKDQCGYYLHMPWDSSVPSARVSLDPCYSQTHCWASNVLIRCSEWQYIVLGDGPLFYVTVCCDG